MEENLSQRRGPGRPRKVVPDTQGVAEIQVLPSIDGGDGEIAFVEAEPSRSPAPSRWVELTVKALELDETQFVTQIHTRDNRSGMHSLYKGEAVIIGNQESDFLVTSDGTIHNI